MKGSSSRGTWDPPAGNSSLSLEFLVGKSPCPAPKAATPGAAAAPSPPGASSAALGAGELQPRAPHTDSGNDGHGPAQPCPLQPLGSAQQFHPGISSVWAPLEPETPQKSSHPPHPSPRAGPGTSKAHPGLPAGHHTYLGRWGGQGVREGGSQPCSIRESLILHQGNKQKALLGFSLGEGWRERTGGGNSQSLGHGLELSPCAENYRLVQIFFPVPVIGIKPGFGISLDTQSLITQPGVQLPVLL